MTAIDCQAVINAVEETDSSAIGIKITAWGAQHGRDELPWQHAITPYKVWISEVMLQQTQVSKVIPFFQRFIAAFPDAELLAAASEDQLFALWSGLGYYTRARNLSRAAQIIVEQHGGQLPSDQVALEALPGLGRSTASAVRAIGFNQRAPILDGNVKRVLARLFAIEGWPGGSAVQKTLWELSELITPDNNPRAFTQSIMDFGATFCTRSAPNCCRCPLSRDCRAYQSGWPERYPAPKPQRNKPVRSAQFILVSNHNNELLLARNRNKRGVWRGLWLFPQCQSGADPVVAISEGYQLVARRVSRLPPFRHTFSHYHLDIEPIHLQIVEASEIAEHQDYQWSRSRESLQGGVPTPVQRLFDQFYVDECY